MLAPQQINGPTLSSSSTSDSSPCLLVIKVQNLSAMLGCWQNTETAHTCSSRPVLNRRCVNSGMMSFYDRGWLCSGMTINHGLRSTAKCHLLLSAPLVVGRDYSQNQVQTGWLIEGSAKVWTAVYFLHPVNTHSFYSRGFELTISIYITTAHGATNLDSELWCLSELSPKRNSKDVNFSWYYIINNDILHGYKGPVPLWLTHIDYCCLGPPCWPTCHQVARSCTAVWLRKRNISWGRIRHVKELKPELMSADGLDFVCLQELSSRTETEGEMIEDSEGKRFCSPGSLEAAAPPSSHDGPPSTAFKKGKQEQRQSATWHSLIMTARFSLTQLYISNQQNHTGN